MLPWAVEEMDPKKIPVAVRNWLALRPEERWWLFGMTAIATGGVGDAAARLAYPPVSSYTASMKSLTIRLPNDMAERLERESRERGLSKSDLVRERLSQDAPRQPTDLGLMKILEASWADSARDRSPRSRSPHKRRLVEAIRAKKLPR